MKKAKQQQQNPPNQLVLLIQVFENWVRKLEEMSCVCSKTITETDSYKKD